MITLFAVLLCILYAAGMLVFGLTLWKRNGTAGTGLPPPSALQRGRWPSVSIIVAARNEESRIDACLSSLSRLSYPRELLEIIVVDDHSTDRTAAVVLTHAGTNPGLRLVHADEPRSGRHGKVNALITGVEQSRGDILLFTDADCTVPPGWVESTMQYYADERVAIVAGFITVTGKGWLPGIQGLDWLLLLSAASAAAALRFPVTAVGNNLSIRRSAYLKVGGFEGIPFSVTEDFALVNAVTTNGAGTVVIPLDPGTTIETLPCENLAGLFAQRKRWFVGGRGMPVTRMLAFSVAWLFHLALIPGFWLLTPGLWVLLMAVKLAADFFMVLPSLMTLKQGNLVRYWLHFQVYLWTYVLVLPLGAAVKPRVWWKERAY